MADEIISTNLDEIGDFWGREVLQFLKPIVEANNRLEPSPVGSGVIIAFGGKHYLVTANHVISAHLDGTAKGAAYTYLPEQTQILGPILSVNDPFDLALVELPTPALRCLTLPRHLALKVRDGELCLFVGLQARPKSWKIDSERHTLRPTPLSYLGMVRNASQERFGIRFNQKQLRRGGAKWPPVGKLNGISGSGVFVLRDDMPALAGIIIEYHGMQSEIVSTSSLVLWEMLKRI